jgi:hypothetical protein
MWLNFTLAHDGLPFLVNMDRVQEARPVPNQTTGAWLIFGLKTDGAVDQVRVSESVEQIRQMLGVDVFITDRMTDGARVLSDQAKEVANSIAGDRQPESRAGYFEVTDGKGGIIRKPIY